MKRNVMFLLMIIPIYPVLGQQPDAEMIMNRSREMSITGSMSADVSLTITEKNGSSRHRSISMTTRSYPDGIEKRFIKFREPADVRGTALLVIDNKTTADEMWIYLPALRKTRRIVSTEKGKSFMSSEFSNADMSSPSLSDFLNKHLDGSGMNSVWQIESKPLNEDKADEYGYSRKVSFINMESYRIMKMEFYNYDNELYKTIEIKSIYPLQGGKFIVKDMVAENLLTKRKSEISFSKITEGSEVDDSVFSLKNLEK